MGKNTTKGEDSVAHEPGDQFKDTPIYDEQSDQRTVSVSHRKVFKRIIRKLAKCILSPIINRINEMNPRMNDYDKMIAKSAFLQHAYRKGKNTDGDCRKLGNNGRDIYHDNQLEAVLICATPETQIEPAFAKLDVSVLFSASDSYTNYVGSLVQSIIENSNASRTYDLIIFETDISTVHMNMIYGLASAYNHISIRFVDVKNAVDLERVCIDNSAYNYFTLLRLLTPELLAKYEKVLYLDADTIVNADISELFDTDLSGYCLAGALDPYINARMTYENEDQAYLQSIGLTEPWKYMQSGVLLLNVEQLRKTFPPFFLFGQCQIRPYRWVDQDIFNIFCKGMIKYLDLSWNVFVLNEALAITLENHLPDELYEAYTVARRKPKIIHYVSKHLPDIYPDGDIAEIYWRYARHTPFYEKLIYS